MKIHSRGNVADLGLGIEVLPDDRVAVELDAQQLPELRDVALGFGRLPPPNMPIMPPGGCFGWAVPTTLPNELSQGNGSSKMAVGWPDFTAWTKLSIASGVSDDGCTASSTSYFLVIGFEGSTSTTSYCFFSSVMICDSSVGPCIEKPPKSWASVFSTPSFLRSWPATVQIERTSSYSTGMPRSMNGITTLSRPELNATPKKTSSRAADAAVDGRHVVRLDAVGPLGERGRLR